MSLPDRSFGSPAPEIVGQGSPRLATIGTTLIVVAHPDDVEAHCGGTVGLLTQAGCTVHLVVCTSGEKGTADRSLSPEQLGEMRESEQERAAETLGIASTNFLRYPDGEIPNNKELRGKIVSLVRQCKPDLVITHDPEFPWPAYTAHRDHRAVGRATLDALYPDARDHLFFPEQLHDEGVEPHVTPEAWLIMSRVPDLFVNISSTIDQKISARLKHASQHSDANALDQAFRARAAEIGKSVGSGLAEALKIVRFA
jgi:LmbE family N-acetylglucosaminyl deacetylase